MDIQNQDLTSTKAFSKGFVIRLDALFEALGVRQYGRITRTAEWSRLSVAGARKLFQDDRPPNEKAFESLSLSIQTEATKQGKEVGLEKIKQFLLYGGINPLKPRQQKNYFQKLDPLAQASVHMALADAGKTQQINIITDFTKTQLEYLLNKLAEVHTEKAIGFATKEMQEIATSLVTLAKSNILL